LAALVSFISFTVHRKNMQHANPKQIMMVASIEKAEMVSLTFGNTNDAQTNTVIVEMYTNDCLEPTSWVLVSSFKVI